MKDVLRQVLIALTNPVRIGVWSGVTGVVALAGPFGTYDAMPLLWRLPYWAASTAFALIVVNLLHELLTANLPDLGKMQRAGIVATGSAILITAFITLGLWTLDFDYAGKAQMSPPAIFVVAFVVVAIIETLKQMRAGEIGAGDAPREDEPRPEPPRLVRRLDPELGEDVIHVTSKDHLIEIATRLGSMTIRMRLADAVDELEGADGFCTHRSHWVARDAITGRVLSGRRPMLVLCNGTEVPVSKKYEPEIRAMGYLS